MRDKMLLVADRLDKRADAILDNLYRGHWEEQERLKGENDGENAAHRLPFPTSQMAGALRIFAEEIRDALSQPSFHEYDNIGDLFTLEDFVGDCGTALIDSDGEGYYALEARTPGDGFKMMVSDRPAMPSRIAGGDINKEYTHVAWYNK